MPLTGFGWGLHDDSRAALRISLDDDVTTFEGPPLDQVDAGTWVLHIVGALWMQGQVTDIEAGAMIVRGRQFYEREGWPWPKPN